MIGKAINFLREVWQELGKVTWPTRIEAIKMTATVVVVSVVVAVFLGVLDLGLTKFVTRVIAGQ